jgi:hypothetical protein
VILPLDQYAQQNQQTAPPGLCPGNGSSDGVNRSPFVDLVPAEGTTGSYRKLLQTSALQPVDPGGSDEWRKQRTEVVRRRRHFHRLFHMGTPGGDPWKSLFSAVAVSQRSTGTTPPVTGSLDREFDHFRPHRCRPRCVWRTRKNGSTTLTSEPGRRSVFLPDCQETPLSLASCPAETCCCSYKDLAWSCHGRLQYNKRQNAGSLRDGGKFRRAGAVSMSALRFIPASRDAGHRSMRWSCFNVR